MTSAIAHAGGIIFSVYMLPRMEKTTFVSTLNLLLFVLDTAKLVLYCQLDIVSRADILRSLWLIPVLGLGVWLGGILHHRLSQHRFVTIATSFVGVMGVLLISR